MTESEKMAELTARYTTAIHRVQCGVGIMQQHDPKRSSAKHIRTGIDSLFAGQKALSQLLIAKGVFTAMEYHAAMTKAAEEEAENYQAEVQKIMGPNVRLG